LTSCENVNNTQDTRLTSCENVNTTQSTDITNLQYKTQHQTISVDNITTFNKDIKVLSVSYGTLSMLTYQIDILNNAYNISVNNSRILSIESVNLTQNTRIDDVELKTRHQTSAYDATSFATKINCLNCHAINDPTYGTVSILGNRAEIVNIQTVNTTQNTNISALDTRVTDIEYNTQSTTNVLLVEDFINSSISLTAGGVGSSS
jgi:hypothetical protein